MIFFLRSVSESPSCTGHFHLNVSPGFSFAAAENGNALAGIERSEHFVLALLAPQRKPIVTDIHRDAEWIAESLLSIRVDSDRRQRTSKASAPFGFPVAFYSLTGDRQCERRAPLLRDDVSMLRICLPIRQTRCLE